MFPRPSPSWMAVLLALACVACGTAPGPRGLALARERVVLGELVADGIAVVPGTSVSPPCDLRPRTTLRLVTAARSTAGPARLRFRVALPGRPAPLLDATLAVAPGETREAPHEIDLGVDAPRTAALVFSVEGDPAEAAFLTPTVGPSGLGTSAARPWGAQAPDVVLLVADTFRADLLADWGGPVLGTPNLNRLARRGTRFLGARSVATWTLPATVSLLTGLFPLQHGARNDDRRAAPELTTLAQRLRAAGYRTGAITDGGFVSARHGLDAGFEWFREHDGIAAQRIGTTLAEAEAFLARDDGRPVFLLVHTYRTHWPYRSGVEESSARHDALVARFAGQLGDARTADPDALAAFASGLLDLYRDGARDLDAALGPWIEALDARGVLAHGLLVFTSDHGEAFFEHGKSEHRGLPFEEEIRVPLLLVGADVPARDEPAPVSLVDLAPTLAARCGLAPDPAWSGRDLLAPLDPGRAVFAWHGEGERGALAAVRGTRKLFAVPLPEALRDGEVRAAFELDVDPLEHDDRVRAGARWPAELARSVAPGFARLATPLAAPVPVAITPERARALELLGYGGR